MKHMLVIWAGNAIALYAAVAVLGDATLSGWGALLFAAAVFSVINALVKPIVTLLALPVIVLTVGLAMLLVNVLMLWLTELIVSGIEFDGFVGLLSASIIIWFVNMILTWLPGPWRRSKEK